MFNITTIIFNDIILEYSDEVRHLGHILCYNLDDNVDIVRAVKDMNRMANSIICSFSSVDPFLKSFLIQTYCLSLYGCVLWNLSSTNINLIEVTLNIILRKVWNLPPYSHTAIVHCVAGIPTISDIVYHRFCKFLSRGLSSSSELVSRIFHESSLLAYTFTGYSKLYGNIHKKNYIPIDCDIATFIRSLRTYFGIFPALRTIFTLSPAPNHFLSLIYISPLLLILHLLVVCYNNNNNNYNNNRDL